jgi:DNA-directed RNA polymerase specialized sigma24 family protein
MQPDPKTTLKTAARPLSTITLGALHAFESAEWTELQRTIMAIVHGKAMDSVQKADMEDITQGLLIRLSRMAQSGEFAGPTGQRPLLPYLRVATANALKDFWRTRDRTRVIPHDDKSLEFAIELSWRHKGAPQTDLSWINMAFQSLSHSDQALVSPGEDSSKALSPSGTTCKKAANRLYKRRHDARRRFAVSLVSKSMEAGIHMRGASGQPAGDSFGACKSFTAATSNSRK